MEDPLLLTENFFVKVLIHFNRSFVLIVYPCNNLLILVLKFFSNVIECHRLVVDLTLVSGRKLNLVKGWDQRRWGFYIFFVFKIYCSVLN